MNLRFADLYDKGMRILTEKLKALLNTYKRMVNILFTSTSCACVWSIWEAGGMEKVSLDLFAFVFSNTFFVEVLLLMLTVWIFGEMLRMEVECRPRYGKIVCILINSLLLVFYTKFGNGWVISFFSILSCVVLEIAVWIIRVLVGIIFAVRNCLKKRKGVKD